MAKTATPVPTLAVVVTMTLDKETKGAVRYSNTDEGTVIPTLYVRKEAFEGSTIPATITVTVSV